MEQVIEQLIEQADAGSQAASAALVAMQRSLDLPSSLKGRISRWLMGGTPDPIWTR